MTHISPSSVERVTCAVTGDAKVSIACGGALLQVKGPPRMDVTRPSVSRGTIHTFSASSRKRLITTLASIDRNAVRHMPLFITLTYPGEYDNDPQTWKRHLDAFNKALTRAYPAYAAVWRLEFQKRGAPHFHLLVFNVQWIPASWIARTWSRIVGSADPRHEKAGTQVKKVKSWRGVMSYASKYLAKTEGQAAASEVGRFWGIFQRRYLPIHVVAFTIATSAFWVLRRVVGRWSQGAIKRGGGANRWKGFTLYGDTAKLAQLLRVLEVDL